MAKSSKAKGKLRDRLLIEQDYKCYYCERFFDFDWPLIPTIEHIYPRSLGGIKTPDNVALSCVLCNREKADKLDIRKGQFVHRWSNEYIATLRIEREQKNASAAKGIRSARR